MFDITTLVDAGDVVEIEVAMAPSGEELVLAMLRSHTLSMLRELLVLANEEPAYE